MSAPCPDSPCQVHTVSHPGAAPSSSCRSRGCQGGCTTAVCMGRRSETGRDQRQLAGRPAPQGPQRCPAPHPTAGLPSIAPATRVLSHGRQDRPECCPELCAALALRGLRAYLMPHDRTRRRDSASRPRGLLGLLSLQTLVATPHGAGRAPVCLA